MRSLLPLPSLFVTLASGCGAPVARNDLTVLVDWMTGSFSSAWDRGFDSEDAQVWGAAAGPYVFVRAVDAP